MTIEMNGKLADEGNLSVLTKLFKDQTVYLGLTSVIMSDTSTLSNITEITETARTNISSKLGTPALVDNVPTLKNNSQIDTANFTTGGLEVRGWFITDASSGTSGKLLAYGNKVSSSLYTNAGSPVSFAINSLIISID